MNGASATGYRSNPADWISSTMLAGNNPLDERKQNILRAVVHDYTTTAEPVSSEMLAYRYKLGVKPATIRNEMAEMVELGYLRQPHTSAGRVPSDQGYRFYVEQLMSGPGLSAAEEDGVMESYSNATVETDSLLQLSCRILSTLTHHASVATEPMADETSVRYISVSILDSKKLLLALVLTDGRVQHSILDVPSPMNPRRLAVLAKAVSEQIQGRRVASLLSSDLDFVPPRAAGVSGEYAIVIKALRQLVRESRSDDVHVEGTARILSQPEFKDIAKLEALLSVFEQRKILAETLNAALEAPNITIIIGHENPYAAMRDCSLVTAHYRIGSRPRGAIGVIGPTRMNYRRAVASVNLLAQSLSQLLTSISTE